MVVSLHDVIVTWWEGDLDDSYVRYCRQVTQRVVRQADAIFTVSEWSKQDIIERFGADTGTGDRLLQRRAPGLLGRSTRRCR